ncbi:MAG: deoxyribodipyrimidine photo-lyase/cryptochrome family protein [Chitinophagaceae bacterium]
MTKQQINIVWIKRDIRSQDHLPLQKAEESELPYLIIFLFEPSIITYSDTSLRHLQFQYHSLKQLNKKLEQFNKKIQVFYGEALAVFQSLVEQFEIQNVFSYQETGIQLTFDRDKKVASFCNKSNITWLQFQRDGIVRGIKNRTGWDKQWFVAMHAPIIKNSYSSQDEINVINHFTLPQDVEQELNHYPQDYQPAGEDFAWKYLQSFVAERGKNYSKHISKPQESRTSCSRISVYLSWGNLSIRQAYQYVYAISKTSPYKFAFTNFLTRLKWHCHFIQKFEVECSYEIKCVNAGYELLQHPVNEHYINAWKNGNTGFPLVDACMKCLQKTGWINFRMRAMLVSVFCHHLFQDWRLATYHLAQLFLDYEPGIHYPQFQMQAGTTGINTIRMYNPIKQSQDHDPHGLFIKKWLPQLNQIPVEFIHEPYKMSLIEQQLSGVVIGKDYPFPIVDIELAGKEARKAIWGHRSNELVKKENLRILYKHTRRKENDVQP